ncbi:hypothetical protein BKA70DRAFT_1559045 [Coprinopsis sp. MPI-PUGE-AT-0042]|nr:hypothetical protein BKA70DRAFT_1559045 [Coprinopsis sp. MPI-PUGE-AT-0042]
MKYLLRLCTVLLGTIQLINASQADDAEAPAVTAVSVPLNTIHKRRGAERYGRAMAADRPYTPMATPVVASAVPLWGQCGGKAHAGPIACADASAQCVVVNEWYHQCRPGPTKPPPPPPTPPTTTRPTPPPSLGTVVVAVVPLQQA